MIDPPVTLAGVTGLIREREELREAVDIAEFQHAAVHDAAIEQAIHVVRVAAIGAEMEHHPVDPEWIVEELRALKVRP